MNQNKDFNAFLSQEQNYSSYVEPKKSIDPNLFTNDELIKQMNEENKKKFAFNLIVTSIYSVVTAPFTTISTSLQLSVLPHKNMYGDINNPESTTALSKTTKDIQPHEKRKFELLLKSGVVGTNRPFTAPIYTSYRETIKALANQGVLGFYKGNFLGIIHFGVNSNLKIQLLGNMDLRLGVIWHQASQFVRQTTVISLVCLADIIANPFMLFQSRFILQNRNPNFYIYKSSFAAFKKHLINKREYFKGSSVHIYKNITVFLAQVPINIFPQLQNYQMLYFFASSNIVSYPWLTVLRRLHCQSSLAGLLPIRYSSAWHAMRLIAQEEGIRGLYRGFTAFVIGTSFLQYILFYKQLERSKAH